MMNISATFISRDGCLAKLFLTDKLWPAIWSVPCWIFQCVDSTFQLSIHKFHCSYKHILGWPLTVADLEQLDADTYANLCKLKDLDDVEVSITLPSFVA